MSDGGQSTTNTSVINVILGVDRILRLFLVTDCSGEDKTMTFICNLLYKVIDELGSDNIFSVVMDGTCKGVFPLIESSIPICGHLCPHMSRTVLQYSSSP